ncbi:sialic acid-binding Ig-like lectin 15 isoform X3 [Erpetoichthys calabaricus]|uniref:sialic acid-binding Ig-like lectin 15 isoform X3 n=1 Tax=Erpetoichthys calabaricus TaxID=27687 RepID=UPI002234212C|nr:sialic acid-binding Ig-like lectin 15 isoform X3 [Erpetoichthys calabaricus]
MNTAPVIVFLSILLLSRTGSHDEGTWSMNVPSEVTGLVGHPVVFPCTFTHPHRQHHDTLQVIWKVGGIHNGMVVFQCTTHNSTGSCRPEVNLDQRYKLIGNPKAHDLSMQLHNITYRDSNKYFCRVEMPGQGGAKFENKMGTHLHVAAVPKIVDLLVQGSGGSEYNAVCRAEGHPLPIITWTGPDDQQENNGKVQTNLGQHETVQELQNLSKEGRYTCIASNEYGSDRATIYFIHHTYRNSTYILLLMWIALGAKFLIFLLLLGGMAWQWNSDQTEMEKKLCTKKTPSEGN